MYISAAAGLSWKVRNPLSLGVGAAAASTAGEAGNSWNCVDFFFLNDRLLAKDLVHLTREECVCLETCRSDQDDFNWK